MSSSCTHTRRTSSGAYSVCLDCQQLLPLRPQADLGDGWAARARAAETYAQLLLLERDQALAERDTAHAALTALPEWHCPACGATTRARLADQQPPS